MISLYIESECASHFEDEWRHGNDVKLLIDLFVIEIT